MKALIVSENVSTHTARWANGLSGSGVRVCLVTQHPLKQRLDEAIEVIEFPYRGNLGYLLMSPGLCRVIKSLKPDILNAHFASGYGTTGRLANYHPYLLSVWGSDVYSFPDRSAFHLWLVRKNLKAADMVASTSHCMANRVRRIAPEVSNIAITPFGVDVDKLSQVPSAPTLRDGKLVIGTVKAMERIYGIDTLIDAFSVLRQKLLDCRHPLADRMQLRLVGGGSIMEDLRRHARRLGLSGSVEFVGRVPHAKVPDELAKIDIFVALSRQESFGVAVLEAGAAGRPAVVSDAEGLAEVVQHGVTGLVVPGEDPHAAAEALFDLVTDPEKRIALGEAGRQHVRENYAWETCLRNMLSVYELTVRRFRERGGQPLMP